MLHHIWFQDSFFLFYSMRMNVLPACILYMPGAHRVQKRTLVPQELEVQTVVNLPSDVVAGN